MNKITSRKLSKALMEAGAKQESELHWWHDTRRDEWSCSDYSPYSEDDMYACEEHYVKDCSSFDCHELLERLPNKAGVRVDSLIGRTYRARIGYLAHPEQPQVDTPAEALGKLYLWCLQNGHCDKGGNDGR